MDTYDVIVISAGPAGYVVAIRAARTCSPSQSPWLSTGITSGGYVNFRWYDRHCWWSLMNK